MFKPTDYLYQGHNSVELKEELNKYELKDLRKMYKMVSGWKLEPEINNNKELLIKEIIYKSLVMCNRGWVFHPNTKGLAEAPYR